MHKLTVDTLASRVALSRRSLERRFREATYTSVARYVQLVRIEAAKRSLETGTRSIQQIMYDVGYSDPKAFRTTFKNITAMTPTAYRQKYNRDAR